MKANKSPSLALNTAVKPNSPDEKVPTTSTGTPPHRPPSFKLWFVFAALLTFNGFTYLVNFSSRPIIYNNEEAWHTLVAEVKRPQTNENSRNDLEVKNEDFESKLTSSWSSSSAIDDAKISSSASHSMEGQSSSSASAIDDATLSSSTSHSKEGQKKYNVLIFYPDDWRHDTLGVAGTQPVQTPFLDQLSREGIRFTHNCVTTSICWISRATMFMGQYFSRHKSRYIRQPTFYQNWNESYITTMQQNGYYVGHIGKWQFGGTGFIVENYNWTSLYEGVHWHTLNGERVHSTVRDERNAIQFLRERPKDAPFVLTTAFYAPKAVGEKPDQHFPMDKSEALYANVTIPPPIDAEWAFAQLPQFMQENHFYLEGRRRYKQRFDLNVSGMYERFQKKYFRMVTEVDEAIKNVVAELEAQGEMDNTIIIFTTDNGLYHGEHGLAGKWFPHDESIRIPLIIKDPRMSAEVKGKDQDAFTLNIDLATTILGAAGLPPNPRMQGRDISDLYLKPNAKATWRKEFFYEHPGMGYKKGIPESRALVRKNFKYILWTEYKYEQLFDMINDPYEHTDVAKNPEHAELLKEMRERCEELRKSVL